MKKVAIFGAGVLGQSLYARFLESSIEVFMVDNAAERIDEKIVFSPQVLKSLDFDVVYIAVAMAVKAIYRQLLEELNVPAYKIIVFYAENSDDNMNFNKRVLWLEQFATYAALKNLNGEIAEVGVLKGDFSYHINRCFPDKTLYLFDTFENYDERDFELESQKNSTFQDFMSGLKAAPLPSSIGEIRTKLPYPEKALFKKGYFPDTFDVENETFAFVFLDLNFYKPIKAGLELFFPRMEKGGIILIHDYFYGGQNGVAKAVDDFLNENNLFALPSGDNTAVAIIK